MDRVKQNVLAATLLMSMLAGFSGCTDVSASADIDCPMMLKRVKDGVLEIGRRHQAGRNETLMLAESLHDRVIAYQEAIEVCDPDSAETVSKIVENLLAIVVDSQTGETLDHSVAVLAELAASLPVEATPAEEYDD
jgi:hypothetical protein